MDSWVTLDSWANPYFIKVLAIQNMIKEMSLVGAVSNPMDLWVTLKFVENYG